MDFRAFSEQDITLFEKWLNKEHIKLWYGDTNDWLKEIRQRKGEFAFIKHFIVYIDNKAIGFCQYYPYIFGGEDWQGSIEKEGTYSIDYLIGEEEYLSKGYGKQIIKGLIERVFAIEGAERIIVNPDGDNAKSIGVLLANGFIYDKHNALFILEKNKK
ncbi:GNAT family N-acetyltransferase [bacterium]|nr:GNAT family N-acetyltransferase [bacterium]